MTEKIITRHHLYPKSRGGETNETNIILLRDWVHKWIHQVFSNMTPQEQLLSLLSLNSQVLRNDFKRQVRNLILNFEYIYVKWVKK